MKNLLILALLTIFIGACSPSPKPIEYGEDACHFCKMTIMDPQHAAEAVTDKGKVYKFDAIECLVHFQARNPEIEYSFLLVNDYQQPTALIDAEESFYLISEVIPSPMGAFLSGFANEQAVEALRADKGGEVYKWEELKNVLVGKQTE